MPLSITVYFNHVPIKIYVAVAERLGLQADQQLLTEDELRHVVAQNATHYALLAVAGLREMN